MSNKLTADQIARINSAVAEYNLAARPVREAFDRTVSRLQRHADELWAKAGYPLPEAAWPAHVKEAYDLVHDVRVGAVAQYDAANIPLLRTLENRLAKIKAEAPGTVGVTAGPMQTVGELDAPA